VHEASGPKSEGTVRKHPGGEVSMDIIERAALAEENLEELIEAEADSERKTRLKWYLGEIRAAKSIIIQEGSERYRDIILPALLRQLSFVIDLEPTAPPKP